jgi:hypothetical protein
VQVPPNILLTKLLAEMLKNVDLASEATAFAMNVSAAKRVRQFSGNANAVTHFHCLEARTATSLSRALSNP